MQTTHSSSLIYLDHEHCLRRVGNLLFTLSNAPPNLEYLSAWSAETDKVVRETGSLINFVVIAGTATVPPEEAKAEIRKAMNRHQKVMLAAVYVVEATGFLAAAMRSAVSLTALVARYPFPQKTFGTAREASAWLAELTKNNRTRAITAPTLQSLLQTMRSELKTHAPPARKASH